MNTFEVVLSLLKPEDIFSLVISLISIGLSIGTLINIKNNKKKFIINTRRIKMDVVELGIKIWAVMQIVGVVLRKAITNNRPLIILYVIEKKKVQKL